MKKLNHILNIIIGAFVGVFIGHGIYVYWDFKTHPDLYAVRSAPWYTNILVYLELDGYTEGRAKRIISYIKSALRQTDSVEIWNVWLMGYWEFDDRPYIRKKMVYIDELTANELKELIEAENWDNKDKNRPSFYCLELVR